MSEHLLEVKNLKVSFHTYAGEVQAVRGVSFKVNPGECMAIVGESGSGKTVTSKAVLGLIATPPGEIKKESEILFEGKDILKFSEKEWRGFRGKEAAMIFQDPMTSLNPTMKVGKQIMESIILHNKVSKAEARKQAVELLRKVNIPNPEDRLNQYPYEFSGGMRQRVVIAIALACNPKLMIADEPTTALDVTIQAQIMKLLKEIQQKNNTAVVLIPHDLGVVAGMAEYITVMYAGCIVEQGTVEYAGKNVTNLKKSELSWFKKRAQMIFQDPYASLDPRMTVGDIIKEGMENFGLYPNKDEREERVYELLRLVGLNKEHATRFPHEFSGGQRQRIGIARALAVDPEFIVCDEPISALDVSIQAQVVNLLVKLQRELGLTYLFIAHDLSMVKHISDRVGVMYMGHIVELASSKELYANPQHPYTKALLSAIPIPNPEKEKNKVVLPLEGEVGSPINCGPGCRFASRCKYATERCKNETPVLKEIEKEHFAACHLFD